MFAQEVLLHAFIHVCDGGSAKSTSQPAETPAAFRPRALSVAARFAFSGHAETWTVPRSGLFRITARGAKAADGAHRHAWHDVHLKAPQSRSGTVLQAVSAVSAEQQR